jgi:general secretion pathway protein N
MSRIVQGLALGIAAYLVALALTAPARLVTAHLPEQVRLTAPQGTLWSGRAARVQLGGFELDGVRWRIQPWRLLLGGLGLHLSVAQAGLSGEGELILGLSNIRVQDTRLQGDIRVLGPYLDPYGVEAQGDVELEIASLSGTREGLDGAQGTLSWRNARLERPASVQLGEVSIALSQDRDTALATLSNRGGELKLDGKLIVKPGWQYSGSIRIEPTPNTPKDIREGLKYLGRVDTKGAVTLAQAGNLVDLIGP